MINNGRTGTPKTCRLLVASGFHTTSTALAHLIYISESVIEGYLRWLQGSNWRVIDAETFLHSLDFPDNLPERAVLRPSMMDIARCTTLRFPYCAFWVPVCALCGRRLQRLDKRL